VTDIAKFTAVFNSWAVRLRPCDTAFQNPGSYFHHYRNLPVQEARKVARGIWREINLVNLRENILPTRTRAGVVLRKQSDHSVDEIWLRQ